MLKKQDLELSFCDETQQFGIPVWARACAHADVDVVPDPVTSIVARALSSQLKTTQQLLGSPLAI